MDSSHIKKKIKFYFYKENDKKFVKSLPEDTKISELPRFCLKDEYKSTINYSIYINDVLIENTHESISSIKASPIIIRFVPDLSIKSYFFSADGKNRKTIHFNTDDFFQILDINQNKDIYLFFDSNCTILKFNETDLKNVFKDDENYYYIKFPKLLIKKRSTIAENKKEFYYEILTYLEMKKSELQQLLCVFRKLDQDEKLKEQILNSISKYNFPPLKYFSKKLLESIEVPIIYNDHFLPFLVSLPSIKIETKSYLRSFNDIFSKIHRSRPIESPFKIINLRQLFFNQNIENDSFIQVDSENFCLYRGESKTDPDKSSYYDPIEEKIFDFDFTDLFLRECQTEERVNFEDIFFDTTEYKLKKNNTIGEGTFGEVFIVKNIKNDERYAAKIIKTHNEFNGIDQMRLMRESMILKKIRHPSIVKFIGFNFQSFKDPALLLPTIITEYLPNGSLRKFISEKPLDPTQKYIILLGVCNAMQYLHHNGIIHRDLKPENILIDENHYPQICDFDSARSFPDALTKSNELTASGIFGAPVYMAPEILEGNEQFGSGVDVYAFAIIAYEIIAEKDAYFGLKKKIKSAFQFTKKIIEGERPEFNDNFTEKMKELLKKCWHKTINERLTFEEIFQKLSTDFSYSKYKMDIKKVQNYVKKITKIPNPPNLYIFNKTKIEVHDVEKIFFDIYKYEIIKDKKLGEGDFSIVYEAKEHEENESEEKRNEKDKKYAARIIKTDYFKGFDQMILTRESLMLNKLKHPLIIKFYGLNFQSVENKDKIKPIIINEYLQNGSLNKILKDNFYFDFDDTKKCICLLGISHAMRYIHQQNIIHGYLSLDNILLDENYYPRIKFPHSFTQIDKLYVATHLSNQKYLAPEIFNNEDFDSKIDVYAFAILSYEILTGKEAFYEFGKVENRVEIIKFRSKVIEYVRPKFPSKCPYEIRDFLSKCWDYEVDKRPSFDEIFHELLENYAYLDVDTEAVNMFVKNVLKEEI